MLVVNRYQPIVQAMAKFASPILYLLATFRAQIGGAKKLKLSLTVTPPAFVLQLQTAIQLAGRIKAAIAAGLTPPTISAGLSVIASLKLFIARVQAILSAAAGAQAQVMIYEGPAAGLGPAVQASAGAGLPLTGPSAAYVVTLLVSESDAGATAALKGLFGSVASPLPSSAVVSFSVALAILLGPLGLLLTALTTQLAASLVASAQLAIQFPSFALSAVLVATLIAQLGIALSAGLGLPTIALSVDVGILFILALEASLVLPTAALMATLNAGAQVMAYSGPVSGVGAALQAGAGNAPGSPPLGASNVYAVTFLVDASDAPSLTFVKGAFGVV